MATEVSIGVGEEVLDLVRVLARELHPARRGLATMNLDASLESDFGLDSLARAELLIRIEKVFGIPLPESVLSSAETPRDLVMALLSGAAGHSGSGALADGHFVEPMAPAEPAPDRTRTLLEVLDWHVQRHPDRTHILYYPGDGEAEELTFGELARRSGEVAAGLRNLGLTSGQTVGIMLPTCLDYFAAFFGAQLAGCIPVPLYPPARRSQIEDHLRRQAGILKTAQAEVLVTFPEVLPLAKMLRAHLPGLRKVLTVQELSIPGGPAGGEPFPDVRETDIAFLQFTSGSTGSPKGVTLTHANLLANLRVIGKALDIGPEDVCVSWLPLYHDMGLIGSWMGSLYYGLPLVLMSPLTFLARPSRWLWAIHRHRGTLSPAPNFAYELCVGKVKDAEIEGLDLSSWRYALNGAEPVIPEAMRRFTERYSRHGFDPRTMSPVYGLAECSLGLAFTPLGRGPLVDVVDRETFQRSGAAVPVPADHPSAQRFVSCGLPAHGHEIRIVDDTGHEVGERREGNLEFRGPSATSGYYRNPEATSRLIRNGWLDSGDRAYIAAGEIYVTGRVKDIIIRSGRNLYPHELEEAVGEIPGVRKGCVAVFGSPDPETGTERVVVLAETRERDEASLERLRHEIQEVAVDLLGTPADEVVLVPPQTVPKTSSGKVRRASSRDLYESGRLGHGKAAVWWQLTRLAVSGLWARTARRTRTLFDLLYGVWFWLLFLLIVPFAGLVVCLTPGLRRRRGLARVSTRVLAALTGMHLKIEGVENVDRAGAAGPRIVASNHASYLDAFILMALLPPDFGFVAKRELEGNALARMLLRSLGTVFVERFDASQGVEETRKVAEVVRSGDSVAIFPEGTFIRVPGLLPFRMGAFVVAAQTGAPVLPVVIRGSRSKLRDEEWLPRRGGIDVVVRPAVWPEGSDWAAAVRLREVVRTEILAHAGEPDLG